MNLDDYQQQALSTKLPTADWMYLHLNLPAEVGELLGLLAKRLRDGGTTDLRPLAKKELGDILWHVACIADDLGFTLEDVAQTNIDKLALRKEKGKIGGSGDERELDD